MSERFTEWDSVQELKSEKDIALYFELASKMTPAMAVLSAPHWATLRAHVA